MLDPVSNQAYPIVRALISAPLAWQRPEDLARLALVPLETVFDALAELESGGWVQSWEEWPEGVAVTFTPLAASRLEIRIVEVGANEIPKWATAGTPDPAPAKASRTFRDVATMGLVIDPSPGPAELAELAEVAPKPPKPKRNADKRPSATAAEAKARRKSKRRARGNARPDASAIH